MSGIVGAGGLLQLLQAVVAERRGPWVADDSEHAALLRGVLEVVI